jgi:hypothetical protein
VEKSEDEKTNQADEQEPESKGVKEAKSETNDDIAESKDGSKNEVVIDEAAQVEVSEVVNDSY